MSNDNIVACLDCGWRGDLRNAHWSRYQGWRPAWLSDECWANIRLVACPQCRREDLYVRLDQQQD